jgi:hypothetical protein
MNLTKLKYWFLITFTLIQFTTLLCTAQVPGKTVIKGIVKDASNGEPLPFVSVVLKNTTSGSVTDNYGKYFIETSVQSGIIVFSFLGYETVSKPISTGVTQVIDISLQPTSFAINEVVIKPKKRSYSNKNNPSIDLIEKVIANKHENKKEAYSFLEYEKYEKTMFALTNITSEFKEQNAFRKFSFIFENTDTTIQKGTEILPIFIKESISKMYYRKNPVANKEIVKAEKTINFSEYIDNKGVSENINYIYQQINIYDNNIAFLTNNFLSPVAQTAPLFYKYFIIDTSKIEGVSCIRLFFAPKNAADFLFQGFLFITQDSTYAIKKIDMGINKGINIDWVKNAKIVQDFKQVRDKSWMLSMDEVSINFAFTERSMGIFGRRSFSYDKYLLNQPVGDSIFRGPEKITQPVAGFDRPEFWDANRQIPLSKTEKGIYTTIDSIKKVPSFKVWMNVIMLLTTDFLTFKKFEIGPVGSFYSFNTIEGSRVRFGGRTTPDFSKKITLDGYVAYGFKDKIFKYSAGITYSLTQRTIHQFPVKSIKLNYQYDTRIPGQELQFAQSDNIFLSFKRGVDDKIFYNRTITAEFLNEFENHFSYQLGFSYLIQTPGGNLFYNPVDYLSETGRVESINIPEAYINLRYAPNEAFYQGKLYRDRFPNKYPVLLLKYAVGSELFGNDYNYSRIQFGIYKRFYPSILGYTDVTAEAGKIFGTVPYPLLFIHRANQTYAYQKYSYNLMNFLEFVSDRYASINIDHCFNGFFLNKIPVLKKFKLREIVTFKLLYGRVSDRNDPSLQSDLFKYPTDSSGNPLTFSLESKPYIEAGIGMSNIFKIFRIDLIKRITYTSNPNVSQFGFRIQFRFDI